MSRAVRGIAVAAGLAALGAAVFAAAGLARSAGGPFYLVPPPPTNECNNVKSCIHVSGPWVVVPAHGEATWLLQCPHRHGSAGGTDVRASSRHVHVWFDAQPGSPIDEGTTTGPFVLYHAITDNGKPGSFEPLLGCIALAQQTDSRSTLAVRTVPTGTTYGLALEPRSTMVVLVAGYTQKATKPCQQNERLVSNWTALAIQSKGPPDPARAALVTMAATDVGKTVHAVITTGRALPFFPLTEVQVGAVCAP